MINDNDSLVHIPLFEIFDESITSPNGALGT